jgi:hypothetical protein
MWSRSLVCAFCLIILGCNTVSNVRIRDDVRKVITYDSNKKIKVVSEKYEMEDPLNFGQWWDAKQMSQGNFSFTARGLANKKSFEDNQKSGDSGDGGY